MKGLGIALVQKGRPDAFGSKTPTECQSRYSNIEREMLAIVHGIQLYHTYLYGRPFKVISDHKPLVTICAKALHATPPRLQHMLLNITSYCRTGSDAQRRCRRDDARCSANHTIATTAACIATRGSMRRPRGIGIDFKRLADSSIYPPGPAN